MFVDGAAAGFREPTVCAIATEVSKRASNAIVVISFRMMDLASSGPTSRFLVARRLDHKMLQPHVWFRRGVRAIFRNHLNCGTGGTDMRGGGIGATAGAFFLPLWSSNCAEPIAAPLALICAVLAELPATEPPVRASEAAGKAKINRTMAIFVAVFAIGTSIRSCWKRRSVWRFMYVRDPPIRVN